MTTSHRQTRLVLPHLRWLCIALVAVGAAVFVVRGVVRGLSGGGDFKMIHSAAVVWIEGGNPYRFEDTIAAFRAGGGDPDRTRTPENFSALYPPSTHLAVAPFGFLPWPVAQKAWFFFNLLLMIPLVWAALRLAGVRGWGEPTWWIIGICLLLAPIHTSFKTGQITILAGAAALGGLGLLNGRAILAGVLLGFSAAVKPQMTLILVVMLAATGHWRACIAACITGLAMLSISIGRMEIVDAAWLSQLRDNLYVFTHGGHGDPTLANENWHLRMDLVMALHAFTDRRTLVQVIAWIVFISLCGGAILLDRARRAGIRATTGQATEPAADSLLLPSILVVATLLPGYHRFYDAILLVLPWLWIVHRVRSGRFDRLTLFVAAMLCMFFLPHLTVAIELIVNPLLPESITGSRLWLGTVMSAQVWVLLGAAAALLLALRRAMSPEAPAPPGTEVAA